MINVKVVIERPSVTDKNRLTYIEMDMDEYINFIKEQADLLGIRKPEKYLTCTDFAKGNDIKISPLHYPPKSPLDEFIKEPKKKNNYKGGLF